MRERFARGPEGCAEEQQVLDQKAAGTGGNKETVDARPRSRCRREKAERRQEHDDRAETADGRRARRERANGDEKRDGDFGNADETRGIAQVDNRVQPGQDWTIADQRLNGLRLGRCELEQPEPENEKDETVGRRTTALILRSISDDCSLEKLRCASVQLTPFDTFIVLI